MRIRGYIAVVLTGTLLLGHYAPIAGAKNRPLRECTDPDYDVRDCEKALELERWKKNQEHVPDDRRLRIASFGEDVLVDKATGYRIGLEKIRMARYKHPLTGVRFGTPGTWKMFILGDGDGCQNSNYVEVIRDAPEFTFFRWVCEFTWPTSRRRDIHFHYLNFDKRYHRLDAIVQGASGQRTRPSLSFVKDTYKFHWTYKENGESSNVFYDFRITGKRPQDIKCLRSWNDDCDIASRDGPLKPSEYKIVE